MAETIGELLQSIRADRGLSIEDVAHETHIQPARIADLENDNYSNFPSLVYARGFLNIYAKHLGIDVTSQLEQLDGSSPLGLENYQYLNAASGPSLNPGGTEQPRGGGLVLKLGALLVLAVALAIGGWFLGLNFSRIEGGDTPDQAEAVPTPAPTSGPEAGKPTPTPAIATPTPTPTPTPAPAPPGNPEGPPEIRKALPVERAVMPTRPAPFMPLDAGEVDETETPPAPVEHEVEIHPLQATWLKVLKNDTYSAPVFENWFTPNQEPLVFRGQKFWIQVQHVGHIAIRKNGQDVPVNGSHIVIE